MYQAVQLIAIGASAVAVISDTIVTGPVDICLLEPNNAAIMTGIKAV